MGGSVLRWVPSTTRVSTHIVAFDMDGTLIKTKSGVCGVFAVHYSKFSFLSHAWLVWLPSSHHLVIPTVLGAVRTICSRSDPPRPTLSPFVLSPKGPGLSSLGGPECDIGESLYVYSSC